LRVTIATLRVQRRNRPGAADYSRDQLK